jgi:drug/metabolite transporter (DMT)-like permease
VLNPVWSWLIHGEKPRAWSLLGGAIILSGTLAKTWMDSRGMKRGDASSRSGQPGPIPPPPP